MNPMKLRIILAIFAFAFTPIQYEAKACDSSTCPGDCDCAGALCLCPSYSEESGQKLCSEKNHCKKGYHCEKIGKPPYKCVKDR